ncbi:MAG: hypothetical protein AABZ47_16190 [Planctomycetota bacterium]
MMRSIASIGVVLASAALLVSPVLGEETKSITATGVAVGTSLSAKEQAQMDAKRNAVKQACGELINAQTKAEDFELKRDRILATAQGYVTQFKVIKESADAEKSYCEISATVSVGKFAVDWAAMFAHIREDVGNVRCMVVIVEDNNTDDHVPPVVNGVVQSKIERYFLDHDMNLVDKSTADEARLRDIEQAALNENIALLASKAGGLQAEIVVFGQARAKPAGSATVGGKTVYKWEASLQVKIVKTDSAKILHSDSYRLEKPETTMNANASGDTALEKLAISKVDPILKQLANAWKKGLTSYEIVTVEWQGCTRADFRGKIAPALLQVRGVQQGDEGVKIREVNNDVVLSEIYWAFSIDQLADAIAALSVEGFKFEVANQSANRIQVKVTSKP